MKYPTSTCSVFSSKGCICDEFSSELGTKLNFWMSTSQLRLFLILRRVHSGGGWLLWYTKARDRFFIRCTPTTKHLIHAAPNPIDQMFFRLVLQLCLPNPLKPVVKSIMKMWLDSDRRCSNYVSVINNFITKGATYIRGLAAHAAEGWLGLIDLFMDQYVINLIVWSECTFMDEYHHPLHRVRMIFSCKDHMLARFIVTAGQRKW